MARRILYKGFSSHEYLSNRTFMVTNVELVKLDILNEIFTRRGERLMMPTYGTEIPDLVFEMLDEDLVEVVHAEIEQVMLNDPRVEILNLEVFPNYDTNEVTAAVKLLFIELDYVDNVDLNIQFEE